MNISRPLSPPPPSFPPSLPFSLHRFFLHRNLFCEPCFNNQPNGLNSCALNGRPSLASSAHACEEDRCGPREIADNARLRKHGNAHYRRPAVPELRPADASQNQHLTAYLHSCSLHDLTRARARVPKPFRCAKLRFFHSNVAADRCGSD